MKLKMLKTMPASRDGAKTETLAEGSLVDLLDDVPREAELAQVLLSNGWAEQVTDAQAAAHLESLEKAAAQGRQQAREEQKASRKARSEAKAAKKAQKAAAEAEKPSGEGSGAPPGDQGGDQGAGADQGGQG